MSGMRSKSYDVFLQISQCEYDVIVLVETWLNPDFKDEEFFDLRTFQVFRKDRDFAKTNCSRGGGVIIAVKRNIQAVAINLRNADTLLDQICVQIFGATSLMVLVSYIPPNSSNDLYNEHVQNVLNISAEHGLSELMVFGDFNLSKIVWSKCQDSFFLCPTNVNSAHEITLIDGFLSIDVGQINHFNNSLNRILDLIFVSKNINYTIQSCEHPLSKTDQHHVAVELEIEFFTFQKIEHNVNCYIDYERCDFAKINSSISSIDWVNIFSNKTVTECYNEFINVVHCSVNEYVYRNSVRVHRLPWYTPGLKKIKNLRNKFYKKYKSMNDGESKRLYDHYSREFSFLNKFLYKQYLLSFQYKIKHNPRSFWHYVQSKKTCSDYPSVMDFGDISANSTSDIVNLFSFYFKSNFENQIPVTNHKFLDLVESCVDFGFMQLDDEDIINGIMNIKQSQKLDMDQFSAFLLKNLHLSICTPLKMIFNKSLSEGTFIDNWKVSFVTPIFKSGRKSNICDYRPIAKLSNVSKIFEHIMFQKIYFTVKPFLSDCQHGFTHGRSTTTNLLAFSNFCLTSFEKGFQVDSIYLDFSKAFDKISHYILISKLSKMGFHSKSLQWISSYLSNRRCIVSIDGYNSVPYIVTSGVPQGSILGPLLFNLFINDISSCISYSRCLLYADDMKLFKCVTNMLDATLLQLDISAVVRWCSLNRMILNPDKTFYLCFTRLRCPIFMEFYVNGGRIQQVQEMLDLGVLFDSKLIFNSHVDYIIPKVYSVLAFIRRHSNEFDDPYIRKVLYTSFVRSKLEYAHMVWNPSTDIQINRIERVQKKFLKFALSSLNFIPPVPSYESRCRLICLPTLLNRRLHQSMIFLYKVISGIIDCSFLLSLIGFNAPCRDLRRFAFFNIPYHRTNYGMNEPILKSLREFNRICELHDVDFSYEINVFKRMLDLIYY